MVKVFEKVFILWLTVLPLVVWGGLYEGPKVLAFLVGGFTLSIIWLIRLIKSPDALKFNKSDYWFLSWFFVLVMASLFGVHPPESLIGGSYRHQGVIFFLSLWLVGKTVRSLPKKHKLLLIKGMGISVLIESIIVLSQFVFGKLYFDKSLGTLGEANAVAGFLAIGSFLILQSLPRIYFVLPLAAVFLEQSRSGILSVLMQSGVFIRELPKAWKGVVLPVVLLSLFAVFYLSINKGVSFFESRPVIYRLGFEKIVQKPILGYGAESGEVVYDTAFSEKGFALSGLIVDRTHNLLLDVAMWSGLVGLVLFLGWFYTKFKELSAPKKFAALSFLIFALLQPLSVVHWVLIMIIFNI